MKRIQEVYGWDITEQNELAHFGKPGEYARTFEEYLEEDALKKPEAPQANPDGSQRVSPALYAESLQVPPTDPADPNYNFYKHANR